ncbi:Quinoprotein amine dehydrogenase [Cordyceps militaris CM01]|uniref:Quinoprotein amine dehydrogenase n=1 Tax=Cordyceps militaris (strain CM01) TaxID=983644 RepID=G3JIR2_CORMM|nr:Quinoprotein amine dehydrogenase [Cordyceps militaris CM01]EGX91111.1 Quinoprotein amine dehydrogenase [Cordyceps militaris CM01]
MPATAAGESLENVDNEVATAVRTPDGEVRRHPDQPPRELGPLCASLQESAAAANNKLREYLLADAQRRAAVVPLSRELVEMQTVARLYIRRCRAVVGADDGDEETLLLLPRAVLHRLVAVVQQAGRLVSGLPRLLETLSAASAGPEQDGISTEQLAAQLSMVTATASICTAALNLGLDAMLLGPSLQPAPEAASESELPAYESTQLLEDVLRLRLRLSNSSSDEAESSTLLPAISEFLDQLQSQMGQSSTSLLVPAVAESNAESRPSQSDSASLSSHLPPSSGLQQSSPAYDSVRVEHPAPASISLQHYSRKTLVDGEIVSVAFVTKNGAPFVTANNMTAPTRFYPLHVGAPGQFVAPHGGGCMVFPPPSQGTTAASTPWAYVTDDEPGAAGATASNAAHAPPWQHDGSDFRRPVLCIGDFATGRRGAPPALLGVTPDGNVVVSVWGDVVYRWHHATGAVDSFSLGARRVREGWPVALSPDCRFLLCRNDEGVDVSDAHAGRLLFTVNFSRGFLTAAAFSADAKFLALGKASSWVGPKVLQSTLDIWRLEF